MNVLCFIKYLSLTERHCTVPYRKLGVGMVRSPISVVVITGITPYRNNIRLKRMLLGIFSVHGCKYPKRKK